MEKNLDIIVQTNEGVLDKKLNKRNVDFKELINIEINCNNLYIISGDTFSYEITVENKSETDLFSVSIVQKIHEQLQVIYTLRDVTQTGSMEIKNRGVTFYIDKIKAKESKVIEVLAKVIDNENKEVVTSSAILKAKYFDCNNNEQYITISSNTCKSKIIRKELDLKQKPIVLEAIVGETIDFRIIAENKGEFDIDNVIITDILSSELKFLSDSIKVDNALKPNENIISGINIGELKKGCYKEIIFKAKVIHKPKNGYTTNVVLGQYKYKIIEEDIFRVGETISNESKINIQVLDIDISKKANKKCISLGEEIKYTINLTNNGTIEAKNIFLNEEISDALILIDGGFAVNGQIINNVDLSRGILLGDLNVGEKTIITYKAKYIRCNNYIKAINTTKVKCDYEQRAGIIFNGKKIEEKLGVVLNISTFKYISISERVYKQINKPDIFEVDNILSDVEIMDYHLVKTIEGKSNEGQILTGYKIVLQGIIKVIIEYTSGENNKSVYTLSSYIPFSTFIVLPNNFEMGSKIDMDCKIENMSFKNKGVDSVYLSMCLLLIAKLQH